MANISVIGSGAWGTALAITAQRAGNQVLLWAREEDVVSSINNEHTNRFLPDAILPSMIRATSDLTQAIQFADIVLLVAPAQFTRAMLEQLKPIWRPEIPLVLCAKGIEVSTGLLLTEVATAILPEATLAVLSGPGFASEVAKGKPTATTIASKDGALAERLVSVMGSEKFRPYFSTDIVAPEVCGALKNVIAIAAGVADGCGLGDNGRAALITRGLSEMARFSRALGGHRSTVLGMCGVGDLVLTCCSTQSRNYSFGHKLGCLRQADKVMAQNKATVEGVSTALAVMKRARELNVDMPICEAVEAVLYHNKTVDNVLSELLGRPYKSELDPF
ncbi:MAG: NAD(P)-dependent glycerol-3-phosphate dehydrogenase [Alphaproteobacteria bacterium]|nr:NAD(P)-dependent glycerol-3-phosphate dehydrogenase [Alphaproteobacteria bacterium]